MNKLLISLCLLAHWGFCETHRIDSLKMELGNLVQIPAGYTQDTLRFKILKSLMRAYGDVSIDSAIYYNEFLIRFCQEKRLQNEMIYAHYYKGVIYEMQGKHYESIRSNYQTLKLAEKHNQYILTASILGVLAHSHASLLHYSEALALCERGIRILRAHPGAAAYNEELALLNTRGVIFREMGRLDQALKTNQEMYKLSRIKPFYKWYEAHGLHAIGLVYKEQGKLVDAINYHEKALVLAHQLGSTFLEANIVINMVDVLIRQKKWSKALQELVRAERIAMGLKNASIIMEVQHNLYRVYKNTGRTVQALKAYEKFSFIRDSLQVEKSRQHIAAIQEQYNTEQRANQLQQNVQLLIKKNELQRITRSRDMLLISVFGVLLLSLLLVWYNRRLQLKNKELVRKNSEIKEAHFKGQAIERKRVALELHDNLSSLLSAVNMSVQSINTTHLSESEQLIYQNVKHLVQNAYAEVRNISHNILPAELEHEGLSITLMKLVERLNESLPIRFSIAIFGIQERLPVEIEYNMYSIVLELLNNVIKHAQATITAIGIIKDESGINLSVTDNGIGLDTNQKKRGIGLQNVQARLESLGGSFKTLSPAERGTQIMISIPI